MKVCTSKDAALKYMGHRLLFSEGTSLSSSVNPGMSAIWTFTMEDSTVLDCYPLYLL